MVSLISLSFVINHRLFLVDFIVFSHVNKDLLNTRICFVIFMYKFHFITAIILSRQLIWGWLLYFRGSKTHCVSLYNSRCVKQTIAYKHAAWWVLMLHYIYCFLFMASGSMINLFPRNKIWKIFPFARAFFLAWQLMCHRYSLKIEKNILIFLLWQEVLQHKKNAWFVVYVSKGVFAEMYNLCQSVLTCVFKLGTKLWLISQIMSQFTSALKHVLKCFPEKTSDFAVIQK